MNHIKSVNAYDFDHTIYRGDASIDFIAFCLVRNPRLWRYIPADVLVVLRYIFGLLDRKQAKQIAFAYLRDLPDVDNSVKLFWASHGHKIRKWYHEQRSDSDIIISASPEFLLSPITEVLGTHMLLATRMDKQTGKIDGENCRGAEKLRRLEAYDAKLKISEFYSDSLSDMPLLQRASHPYIVKKSKLIPLADYKPSKIRHFKSPTFLRFLVVGGMNAFLGVVFAYMVSFIISDALLAWVVGYTLSLIPSYFLNAVITFRHLRFNLKQFGSFVLSYIPNFVVQFTLVHLLVNWLGLYRLFAYIIAVAIAVPVTFLLLTNHTFKSQPR